MARDIIFKETAPETPERVFRAHKALNSCVEQMKTRIKNTPTVQAAIQTLLKDYGRDYGLFIYQAVREAFDCSNEQISQYLR